LRNVRTTRVTDLSISQRGHAKNGRLDLPGESTVQEKSFSFDTTRTNSARCSPLRLANSSMEAAEDSFEADGVKSKPALSHFAMWIAPSWKRPPKN